MGGGRDSGTRARARGTLPIPCSRARGGQAITRLTEMKRAIVIPGVIVPLLVSAVATAQMPPPPPSPRPPESVPAIIFGSSLAGLGVLSLVSSLGVLVAGTRCDSPALLPEFFGVAPSDGASGNTPVGVGGPVFRRSNPTHARPEPRRPLRGITRTRRRRASAGRRASRTDRSPPRCPTRRRGGCVRAIRSATARRSWVHWTPLPL